MTTSQASAFVLFTFAEVGPDVVMTGEGSLSTDGLVFYGNVFVDAFIRPVDSRLLLGPTGFFATNLYGAIVQGPASFGTGVFAPATSGTGQSFGFNFGASLIVPVGYVSNAPLSGQSVFAGQTFASLGLTPGTFDYFYEVSGEVADRFSIQIVPTLVNAVAEPAPIALLGIGMLMATGFARRRRNRWT